MFKGSTSAALKRIVFEPSAKMTLKAMSLNYLRDLLSSSKTPINTVHYMLHFPVFKGSTSTAIKRIVNEASARMTPKARSLNDCLYTGQIQCNSLKPCYFKNFKKQDVAFTADVEKAFLQFELTSEDNDATSFSA